MEIIDPNSIFTLSKEITLKALEMMTFKGDVILMGMLLFVEILIYIAVMLKINKIIDNLND